MMENSDMEVVRASVSAIAVALAILAVEIIRIDEAAHRNELTSNSLWVSLYRVQCRIYTGGGPCAHFWWRPLVPVEMHEEALSTEGVQIKNIKNYVPASYINGVQA